MSVVAANISLDDFSPLLPGVIFRQSPDGDLLHISGRVDDITGLSASDWPNQPASRFWELIHEADVDYLRAQSKRAGQSNDVITTVVRLRHPATKRISCVQEHRAACRDRAGALVGFNVLWIDQTQAAIAEKQRADAVWNELSVKLTNVLIHDFNNLMTGIHAISESFRSQLDAGHSFHEGFEFIQRNAIHAREIMLRMASFHSKPRSQEFRNLNELVTDALEIMRKILPRNIRIETALSSESLPVRGYPTDLDRVIIELSWHATRAMPQGGTLRLETSRANQSPPPSAFVRGTPPPLPCICLSISSSGTAVPATELAAMFDPLSAATESNVYGVARLIELHNGAISVESAAGQGTAFRLWLPEGDFSQTEGNTRNP